MDNKNKQSEQDNSKYKIFAISSLAMGILSWLFSVIFITYWYYGLEIDHVLGKAIGSFVVDSVFYAGFLTFPLALAGTIFGMKSVNKVMERIAGAGIVLGIIGIMAGAC